ncbi:MAG: hypothetical protein AB7N80_13090 [Bdellovibrionales bacterium]
MRLPACTLLLALLTQPCWAAVLDFKPLALPIQAKDQLLIKGFDGDVKLNVGKANQLIVKVRQETNDKAAAIVRQTLDEWNFSLQRGTTGIEIVVQGPQAREVWRQVLVSGGAPKFHLDITAPAIPVEMAWRSGKVNVDNWNASLRMTLQEGAVAVNGGTGDAKVVGQDVEIRIKNRIGRVVAESYNGKIHLDNIKGNIDIENFTGDTIVSQSEGNVDFRTFKSPLNLVGGKGRLDFSTVRGPIKLANFSGDLKGMSDEAPITAKISNASEVRITTQSGPVALDLPNSSASVTAASVEGGISGPSHMKADQLAGQRVMRGRLRGSVEGSVVVRTQSGPIRIR